MLTRARKRCDRTRVATLNCRTLLADETLDDLDITLSNNNVTLCALQETRRDGFSSMVTSNYKIYWFGECSGYSGVGFALNKRYIHLVKGVHPFPGSGGRIISIDILLHDNNIPVTFVCAYSPPNSSPAIIREKFYSQLRTAVKPNSWLLGDFNARIGRSPTVADEDFGAEHSNTVGPFSLKGDITPNANGLLLLDIAGENSYRHIPSHFTIKDSKRWTWRHPRYHSRAVLDHIFTPSPQFRNVSRYFVVPQITIFTDHRLSICELTFRPRLQERPEKRPDPVDNTKLRDYNFRTAFEQEVNNLLGPADPNVLETADLSDKIRTVPVIAATSVLPAKTRTKFPKEFSADTIELIRQKRKTWLFLQKCGRRITRTMRETYRKLCRDTKRAVCSNRTELLEREAAELTNAFAQNRFKGYQLLKKQHRKRSKPIMPPEHEFTAHYRQHYQLGPEDPITLAGAELQPSVSDDTLSQDDFDNALHCLNENRAPGHDKCAAEYLKRGGPRLTSWLFTLLVRIWTFASDLPTADRIGLLLPIPKKTSSTSVDTTRPICLLTSIYKLYAITVFQKVRDRVKAYVTWTQAGFIKGRSCANNLWILRRVAERAIEFNVPVYCALVDYKGAFDALNRTTLGRVLTLFLPHTMTRRVLSLYFDAKAKVAVENSEGPLFDLLRGVRQGCPASPSFFTVALAFVSWSIRITFEGMKLVHLHLCTLEYADDQILFTLTAGGMQEMLDFLVETASPFGLRLSPAKCELICFHRPGSVDKTTLPQVTVGGKELSWKQSVVYLGSRFAEHGDTLVAVKHRICCAETVVKRLNDRVFKRRGVNSKLKGLFMDTAVFSSLLYGLEHCAISARDQRCLNGFFLRLAKRVLHLRYDHHLSYEEAEEKLGVTRPSVRLARERLRWIGHMFRSPDAVLQEVLQFVPAGGARGRGRPRLRLFDTIKSDMKERGLHLNSKSQAVFWEQVKQLTLNREDWKKLVQLR